MARVLSLFSGSLASRVATRLVERHPDVEDVCLLHFRSPLARDSDELRGLVKQEWPGVSLRTQSLKREYRRMIDFGRDGAFRLDRSCVHCRGILLSRAVRYMERTASQYVVTGDVLGRHGVGGQAINEMTASLDLEGRILRPLCADDPTALPDTLEAWNAVPNRRMPRWNPATSLAEWAEALGIEPRDPMSSRHRCKLTSSGFGDRVAHLLHDAGFTLNELRLIDFPLYYELRPDAKIVVAMDEQEKRELQTLFLPQDLRVYTAAPHGPMTLVRTHWEERDEDAREDVIRLASRITATHVNGDGEALIPIYYRFENDNERVLVNVSPFASPAEIAVLEGIQVVPLDGSSLPVG